MKDLKSVVFEMCGNYCDAYCGKPADFEDSEWYEKEQEKEVIRQRFKALFAAIEKAGLMDEYEAYREA